MGENKSPQASVQDRLAALVEEFASVLPERLRELQSSWSEYCRDQSAHARSDARIALHRLAGSGAMFNMQQLSECAREAELAVEALPESDPSASHLAHVTALLDELRGAAHLETPSGHSPAYGEPAFEDTRQSRILVLESDSQHRQALERDLINYGLLVTSTGDEDDFARLLLKASYDAVVVDVAFSDQPSTTLSLLANDNAGSHGVPLIFLTGQDTFDARLQAVRAGGAAFVTKPFEIHQLINLLDQCTQRVPSDPYTVVIVDDDPQMAELTRLTLEQAHFQAATANTCERAMALVQQIGPDVIVCDIYMPDCSGTELARVLRQSEGLEAVPIIFLSAESLEQARREAVLTGGDDFFPKSSDQDALVDACRYRAMRYRMIKNLIVRDSLTGLFNHVHTRTRLEAEFELAHRHDYPLCYAMLDLDHFKAVNDRYGHAVGDNILRSLARFLLHRLRGSDVVGRYGGEEFSIILPHTTRQAGEKLLNALRGDFSSIGHAANGDSIHQTCSIGYAMSGDFSSVQSFAEAADQALYLAKNRGRNQVCGG